MSFHYRAVIQQYGGCAVTVATGESGTGKSKAALALFGCAHNSIFSKGTNAGMLERSSRSTLPYGIDDPAKARGCRTNTLDIGELCVDLYNGQKTINLRSGASKPLSTAIIATNFDEQELDRCVLLQYVCLSNRVYRNVKLYVIILYLYLGHCVYIDRLSLHGSEPITLHYIAVHIT